MNTGLRLMRPHRVGSGGFPSRGSAGGMSAPGLCDVPPYGVRFAPGIAPHPLHWPSLVLYITGSIPKEGLYNSTTQTCFF